MELLNQRELHAAAEEAAARVAATLAKAAAAAEADRATLAATLAKEASDRAVARERLLLRHQQERLKRQQYLAGNITERSNIPGHGGDDQPMPNDRHDHVATEWGAHMRGEQKITSRNTQDQFSTAGRLGGGLNFPQDSGGLNAQDQSSTAGQLKGGGLFIHKDLGEPFQIKTTAQRTPKVDLQKDDVRYILKPKKVPINFNAQRTPEVALQKGRLEI